MSLWNFYQGTFFFSLFNKAFLKTQRHFSSVKFVTFPKQKLLHFFFSRHFRKLNSVRPKAKEPVFFTLLWSFSDVHHWKSYGWYFCYCIFGVDFWEWFHSSAIAQQLPLQLLNVTILSQKRICCQIEQICEWIWHFFDAMSNCLQMWSVVSNWTHIQQNVTNC